MYPILVILSLYIVFTISDWVITGIDRWRVKRNILSDPIKRYEYYKSGYSVRKIRRLRRCLTATTWKLIIGA